jgi:AraC family transcriptional regulator
MKTSVNSAAPDFEVKWRKGSVDYQEDVYCAPPALAGCGQQSRLRQAVAVLQGDNAYVEVSEVSFVSPITLSFTPHRPGFTLLSSASSVLSIEYGYGNGDRQGARLENVLFMLPGREITGDLSAGTFRTVTCSFDPHYAERILGPFEMISAQQLMRALDMKSSLIGCILLRLMNEAIFPGPISTLIVESLGNALLVECKHWLLLATDERDREGKLAARHIEIIESHLSNSAAGAPTVTEIAAACGFSDRHFARLFREKFGCSISQYLKSAQIAKAKAYLLETDLPLKEIAYRMGFSSLSNFSFAFRAATGVTPGQFRKAD